MGKDSGRKVVLEHDGRESNGNEEIEEVSTGDRQIGEIELVVERRKQRSSAGERKNERLGKRTAMERIRRPTAAQTRTNGPEESLPVRPDLDHEVSYGTPNSAARQLQRGI